MISKKYFLVVFAFFLTFGCNFMGSGDPVDEFFGNPRPLIEPIGEVEEDEDVTSPDPVVEHLQPYGKEYYTVGPTMGAYTEESGEAYFLWTFSDVDGFSPREGKFACVEPTKLPDRFWEKYDSGEAILDRERVDKKARNLYIPFEDGDISFSLKTRIPGEYSFKICGILDENYTYDDTYPGDGDEITIEVPDQGLIVAEIECKDITVYETLKYVRCQWKMEFANGSEFNCWENRPFSDMTSTDGRTGEGIFEILVEKGTDKEYYLLNAPMRLCGGSECGCGFGPYITVNVREGETVKLSIIQVNEDYYEYKGDGDPITITYN